MQIISDCVVFFREDLNKQSENKAVDDFNLFDFRAETKVVQQSSIIMFVDNSETHILKNRFGNIGKIK